MPSNIGTPDWQRATVSAGKLLASVPSGTSSVTVELPPNAQTIAILLPTSDYATDVTVAGVTTGLQYPVVYRPFTSNLGADIQFFASVMPSLDTSVVVQIAPNPGSEWWVYAMTSTEVVDVPALATVMAYVQVSDPQNGLVVVGWDGASYHPPRTDTTGRVVIAPPANGHQAAVAAGTTQLLAAPGSGEWYLYGLDVVASGGVATTCTLTDSTGNTIAEVSVPTAGDSKSVDLSGFVTSGSVSVTATAAATVTLRYAPGP